MHPFCSGGFGGSRTAVAVWLHARARIRRTSEQSREEQQPGAVSDTADISVNQIETM